ncbi:MAG: hypothetical protein U9N14_03115, partial [Pseudomonadota bacterium]|nr:hypothetical protein [Pseudomonadota bacterium]
MSEKLEDMLKKLNATLQTTSLDLATVQSDLEAIWTYGEIIGDFLTKTHPVLQDARQELINSGLAAKNSEFADILTKMYEYWGKIKEINKPINMSFFFSHEAEKYCNNQRDITNYCFECIRSALPDLTRILNSMNQDEQERYLAIGLLQPQRPYYDYNNHPGNGLYANIVHKRTMPAEDYKALYASYRRTLADLKEIEPWIHAKPAFAPLLRWINRHGTVV